MAAGFVSPSMGKGTDDIEMGRKATWGGEFATGLEPNEAQIDDNDILNMKDSGLEEASPDIRTHVDEHTERAVAHPRRASWGRQSGNWEMSPEVLALAARVGEQNRVGGSTSGLPSANQRKEPQS